jgi:triacylglycerol lipase
MPLETVDGLRPPLEGFPYLAGADLFPFDSNVLGYSSTNAWWLADACFLVYGDAPFVEAALEQTALPGQGFRLDWLGTPDDNRGMVLANDDALIVVFRGTRLQVHTVLDTAEVVLINQNDFWTDSQFLPASDRAGGHVHSGFLQAFAEISDRLDAIVAAKRPGQKLWLTGHSLGGALATLAMAHLGPDAVQGMYTYGSPRVGDAAFVSTLPDPSLCRLVHREDWVTTVPPESLGYVHVGPALPVLGGPPRSLWTDLSTGAVELTRALATMVRELRVNQGDLPFKIGGLADHAPIYYATLLWNVLVDQAQER